MRADVIIARPCMISSERPCTGAAARCHWFLTVSSASRGRARRRPSDARPPQDVEFFEAQVRPLLVESAFDCHTDDEKGGLRLDSRERLLKGGESGPAIVPGDPDASLLIKAVRHAAGRPKMPRSAPKLADAQIAALAEWIRIGAPWPAATPSGEHDRCGSRSTPSKVITAEQRAFWSFQPLRAAGRPSSTDAAGPKTDIDRFVLARLERKGWRRWARRQAAR